MCVHNFPLAQRRKISEETEMCPPPLIQWKGLLWHAEVVASILSVPAVTLLSLPPRNPGVPTVEQELVGALVKAEAVPQSMEDDLSKARRVVKEPG